VPAHQPHPRLEGIEADVARQPRPLVGMHRDAFEIVARHPAAELRSTEVADRRAAAQDRADDALTLLTPCVRGASRGHLNVLRVEFLD